MERIKEEIREKWNISSEKYDSHYQHGLKSPGEREAWVQLLQKLTGTDRKRILDVGCGTGFLSILLAQLGHDITGIDLSPGMLEKARQKASKLKCRICFEEGDAEHLPYEEETFDIVINRHILWTMPHPEAALKEWSRVLKPNGELIIIDGDWFYNLLSNNVKIFIGRTLALIIRRENRFKEPKASERNGLPMTKPEKARDTVGIVRRTGLHVDVIRAIGVEQEEKKSMPLIDRLMSPYKRIVLICKKSVDRTG